VIRRVVPLLFLVLVASLVIWRARAIEWPKVLEALQEYDAVRLCLAGLVALLSYVTYSCYDLVGRAYTRHRIAPRKAMQIAAISYAFNLNFGTLVGGMGFRYRLYSHAGLRPSATTRVLGMSVIGNWLGWFCVAGTAFALGWVPLPEGWTLSAFGLRLLGTLLVALAIAYLLFCRFSRRREWTVRDFPIQLPSARLAAAQVALAATNWTLMALIMFVVLHPFVPFTQTLGVLMTSAVASVIVRVPAGLGVIEAVFLTLLGDSVGDARLLAALLAYRAIYYFAPLLVAGAIYAVMEGRIRFAANRAEARSSSSR
jgi:glycosyltransferase 2 family protein